MDAAKKLIHRNEMLLKRMQALADKKQITAKERANLDVFYSEFDKNEATIMQMRTTTGRIQRKKDLSKRESKAAGHKRGTLAAGIPLKKKQTDGEKHDVYQYEEVPAWAVPKESADGARKMLLFCIADLQLSCKINIRWFNEYSESIPEKGRLFSEETEFTRDEQIQGCVFLQGDSAVSNAIWINYELDPATIPRTVAHEARHIYQAMHRETLVKHGKEADKEPDAIRYAFEAMEAFKHHRSCLEYAINRTNKIIKVI